MEPELHSPRNKPAAPGKDPAAQLSSISRQVVACERCPRLRTYCTEVARIRRRAFADERYWGRPVPSFGDPQAKLLIVGLAPAAHGGNRTGRVFTGDRSGDFLYAALYRAGYANQPTSIHRGDGLQLRGAFIAAAVRCAPPANKPLPAEFTNCRPYLVAEIAALSRLRVVVTLGKLGHDQFLQALIDAGVELRRSHFPFGHGAQFEVALPDRRRVQLVGCYHPSQQNTFTGKLTPAMIDDVFATAKALTRGN